MLFGTPLGLILNLIGLLVDRAKGPAIIGLLAGMATIGLFWLVTFC